MFNLLSTLADGLRLQHETYDKLESLRKRLKPASLRGVDHCVKCGFCCHCRSCIPTLSELKKVAKFLKLTPNELIHKYYAIDKQPFGNIYFLKPVGVNIKDLAGKFIPARRTYNEGKCIFLGKGNLCKIYPVRPKMARITKCWKENSKIDNINNKIINSWGNKLKEEFGIDGSKEEEISTNFDE